MKLDQPNGSTLKSLEHVLSEILGRVEMSRHMVLSLEQASGHTLAEDVCSSLDLPRFDNSAMDGFAVCSSDFRDAVLPLSLELIGESPAGDKSEGAIQPGQCLRVFTGSKMPSGADAVLMKEDTSPDQEHPGNIHALDWVKPWENVRYKGEDIQAGTLMGRMGQRIDFALTALLAASGLDRVKVHEFPKLGIMATGNELIEPGQSLGVSGVYESNRLMLSQLVQGFGAETQIFPIVEDHVDEIAAGLSRAFECCDIVISSGGVSVGDYDLVKPAFEKLGGVIEHWKIAIRPGKPMAFGRFGSKLFFGLPGNPVSAAVTCFLLVCPILLKMQGADPRGMPHGWFVLGETLENKGDRTHFVRVTIDRKGVASSSGLQASHAIGSLNRSHGLVEVRPAETIEKGQRVKVLLWRLMN